MAATTTCLQQEGYHELFMNRMNMNELPPEVLTRLQADGVDTQNLVMSMMRVPAQTMFDPSEFQTLRARAQTVDLVTHLAFDTFYEAASGKAPDRIAPDYLNYCDAAERLLSSNSPGNLGRGM